MLLLMRAMISSTTVSWARSRGAPRSIANRRTATFFMKNLIRGAVVRSPPESQPVSCLGSFYRVRHSCAGEKPPRLQILQKVCKTLYFLPIHGAEDSNGQ